MINKVKLVKNIVLENGVEYPYQIKQAFENLLSYFVDDIPFMMSIMSWENLTVEREELINQQITRQYAPALARDIIKHEKIRDVSKTHRLEFHEYQLRVVSFDNKKGNYSFTLQLISEEVELVSVIDRTIIIKGTKSYGDKQISIEIENGVSIYSIQEI